MPVEKGLKFAANFWIHLYDFQVCLLWLHLLWLPSLCSGYTCSGAFTVMAMLTAAMLTVTNPCMRSTSTTFQTYHLVGCDNRNYLQSGTMAHRGPPADHRSKGH